MSAETDALIAYMASSGVPHMVSGVLGRYVSPEDPCTPHSPGSYHCADATPSPGDPHGKGLAVDFDGPDLKAIYRALLPVAHLCAELICGSDQWLNGQKVPAYDFAANIWDHVHIAVHRAVIVTRGGTVPGIPEPAHPLVGICAAPDGDGYWILAADGAVYAFGSAAYAGRLVLDPAGNWGAGK